MREVWGEDGTENEGWAREDGCVGERGSAVNGGWVGDEGFSGE